MGIILNVPEAGLDYILYGKNNSNILANYIQNQLTQLPTIFNEFGKKIYDNLVTSYNFITDTLTQHNILNKIKQQGIQIENDYIEAYNSFLQLQNANYVMQRWIMSHPLVRQDFLQQNIDGYSDTYKNVFGNSTGEKDYNYRRVMNGAVQFDKEGDFFIQHYIDELYPGDRELNHFEKVSIRNVYDLIDWLYDTSEFDFTSKGENKRFKK